MPREVTESVKVVLRTENGNRLELNSKGNAAAGMLTAFECMPASRREKLLKRMKDSHEEMLRPRCTVDGAPVPGAMCGQAIVGSKKCGAEPGSCEHQREAS